MADDLRAFARQYAAEQGVDPDLVERVYRKEFGGGQSWVSPAGARGPMQLMPGTADDLGVNIDDPHDNVRGGVLYLKQQLKAFPGRTDLALAAYNAGPGRVQRAGGVPNIPETRDYVASTATGADIFGFDDHALAGPGGGGDAAPSGADIFGMDHPNQAGGESAKPGTPKASAVDILMAMNHPIMHDPNRPHGAYGPTEEEAQAILDGMKKRDEAPKVGPGGEKYDDTVVFDPKTGLYSQPGIPAMATGWEEDLQEPSISILKGAEDNPSYQARLKDLYGQQAGRRSAQAELTGGGGHGTGAALEGADALMLGFGDEAMGGEAYVKALRDNAIRRVLGLPVTYSAKDAFKAVQSSTDTERKAYEEEHPKEAMAIQLGGSLPWAFVPGADLGAGARGVSMGGRMLRGAGSGAMFGAVSGAGHADGDLGDRAMGALGGAAGGAVIGGALPPVIAGADRGIRALAGLPREFLADAATRVAMARSRAEASVGDTLARSVGRGTDDLSTVVRRLEDNPGVPGYHLMGENPSLLAEVLAQSPGPGRQILVDAVNDDRARISDNIKRSIDQNLDGRGDYYSIQDAALEQRAAEAKPILARAFSDQMDPAAYDGFVAPLLPRVPKKALAYAAEIAKREGRDPDELGLTAMASEPETATGPASSPDPYFERAYSMVKNRREGKNMQGPSLLEFISKRGGLNELGELSRMDADTWHKGKAFVSKLVQDDGDSADGMAMRAWEAGYFPDKFERPTPNDLFEAMRKELAGGKIYAKPRDPDSLLVKQYADNLERRLGEAGIDPKGTSPKQAWRDLFDYEAENNSLEDLLEDGTVSRPPKVDIGYETRPSLETLHYIKKGIDQELDSLRDPTTGRLNLENNPMAAATVGIRSQFAKALRNVSPDYDLFAQKWGDDSERIDALRLGRNIFSPKSKSELITDRVGDMTPAERVFFRKGVGEALLDQAKSKGGPNAMRQLIRSEEFQDRVRAAFPRQSDFDQFMADTREMARQADTNNNLLANSRTALRQGAREDLEGPDGINLADLVSGVVALKTGGALGGGRLTAKALDEASKRNKSVLQNPTLNQLLAQAMAEDPTFALRLLRGAEDRAARADNGPDRLMLRHLPAYSGLLMGDYLGKSRAVE
jgi:hypothetical protein